jgi:hypothetical protein
VPWSPVEIRDCSPQPSVRMYISPSECLPQPQAPTLSRMVFNHQEIWQMAPKPQVQHHFQSQRVSSCFKCALQNYSDEQRRKSMNSATESKRFPCLSSVQATSAISAARPATGPDANRHKINLFVSIVGGCWRVGTNKVEKSQWPCLV